jgi:hypothetical protein
MKPIEERTLSGLLLFISVIKLIGRKGCNARALRAKAYTNHIQANKEYDVLK